MSIEIKTEVKELAEKIKSAIKIDPKTGAMEAVSKEFYASTLPDGITVDTIKQIHDHDTKFVAAQTLAHGEIANAAAKKNKSLEESKLKVPTVGRSNISTIWKRETQNNNPATGEKIVKYGVVTAKLDFHGTHNAGQYGAVKAFVSEDAAKKLAD